MSGQVRLHQVGIPDTGESFCCPADMAVLEAMERASCKGIPVGCRNGGCGACKVQVRSGEYVRRKMSRAVLSPAEAAEGLALACRIYPLSDLQVTAVNPDAIAASVRKDVPDGFGSVAASVCTQPDEEK